MGRLFLSSSYRPRAREGEWASISHIILRPRAREGEWDVFFSHHPIDLGPGRESGASIFHIILRPRAREGEWDVFFSHHPKT